MGNDKNTMLEPSDTSWFDNEPEKYLSRDDFREFQEVSGVELRDLVSKDEAVVRKAQDEIVAQTRVLNEVRNQHEELTGRTSVYKFLSV
ncbi:MAG: hypothetical protein H8D67_19660 [Deltaproteobacteria bacterium]|nr:hypothetical protein [Deltaproteobacteria bacterium]